MSERFKEHAWKACVRLRRTEGSNPSLSAKFKHVLVVRIGLSATICCEPRQVRKEATVITDSGAGVRLVRAAT